MTKMKARFEVIKIQAAFSLPEDMNLVPSGMQTMKVKIIVKAPLSITSSMLSQNWGLTDNSRMCDNKFSPTACSGKKNNSKGAVKTR
jgi:hypothetical protein